MGRHDVCGDLIRRVYAGPANGLCVVASTHRPGRDSLSAGAEPGWWRAGQAILASSRVHQNSVPSVQMQRRV